MDMSQYLEIFIEETKEHLQSLNQCLLKMEKDPEDGSMLNEIFRVAHTLKGMSGTMGFTRMARLTHDMEDVLQALRSNEIKMTPTQIDLLFKCLDALDGYTNMVVETSTEGTEENLPIINALADIIKNKGGATTAPLASAVPAPAAPSAASRDNGDENYLP
jgi:two-component system chemotaxis sensor kinase CheA